MTKNLKEIVLQQIYDILVGKENEIDKNFTSNLKWRRINKWF